MTFILALANPDYAIQVADRRLSGADGVRNEHETKSTVWWAADARLLCGFAGLAGTTGFRTSRWLCEALCEASKEDCLSQDVVHRFVDIATRRFQESPVARLDAPNRRLSVMFTGFYYGVEPPLAVSAIVTNFQDHEAGTDSDEPWDEFRPRFWFERRPASQTPTYVQMLGAWTTTRPGEFDGLREMLARRLPARDVVERAVATVRQIGERPSAVGTIGPHLMSVVLGSDTSDGPSVMYHSDEKTHRVPLANGVVAERPGRVFAYGDGQIEAVDKSGPPVAVPKVGRNERCPCGSGRKYKTCHGYWREKPNLRIGWSVSDDTPLDQ